MSITQKSYEELLQELSALKKDYDSLKELYEKDITERKITEDALRESERKYRLLADNSVDNIWIRDMNLQYTYISPSIIHISGYTAEEEMKRTLPECYPPETLLVISNVFQEQMMLEASGTADPFRNMTLELEVYKKDGSTIWIETQMSFLRDEELVPLGILGITRDITQRKIAENEMKDLFEQLKQSKELLEDAIAAKNKFFSIIAHDLKNPFQVLLNSSYLLENNFNSMDDSKKIKMIKSISQSSNFTYSLLENLLKWSSTQTGTMKFAPSNINLKWLAEKAIQVLYLQAEQKNIQLSVEIPEQYNAFCDSDMIDTVFRNVVSNAIKFSNEAGKVSIKASINSDSTGYLLSIEDSGVGMPEDIRIRIFDLAENVSRKGTQKERGSGLGLILCKEFIEKHGGWIWVESEEGKGSTFNFTLPL